MIGEQIPDTSEPVTIPGQEVRYIISMYTNTYTWFYKKAPENLQNPTKKHFPKKSLKSQYNRYFKTLISHLHHFLDLNMDLNMDLNLDLFGACRYFAAAKIGNT